MNGQMLVDYVTLVAVIIAVFAVFVGVIAVMERKRGRRRKTWLRGCARSVAESGLDQTLRGYGPANVSRSSGPNAINRPKEKMKAQPRTAQVRG